MRARLVAAHALAAVAMATPWPALLALTWEQTGSNAALALVGAARVAPYVLLSWWAGSLGDRLARDRVVATTTWLRVGTLAATAGALALDELVVAVVAATLTVAVGTPAYPTLAAAMPDVAGADSARTTRWLVTSEVGAFTAGPALGGLVLALGGGTAGALVAAVLAVASGGLLATVPRGWGHGTAQAAPSWRQAVGQLVRRPVALASVANVSAINFVLGAVTVGLLALFDARWVGGEREFGLATAAVGIGALVAPLACALVRLPATAQVRALAMLSGALLLVLAAPGWEGALLPLAAVGVAATQVECAATTRIQEAMPRRSCASALGVTDTAMVGANLVGAASAPYLVTAVGTTAFLLLLAGIGAAGILIAPHPGSAGRHARARAIVVPLPRRAGEGLETAA